MKQVLFTRGRVSVDEVPAPSVVAGHVLVQVEWSCISTGTELSVVHATGRPLWRRLLSDPEKLRKAWRMLRAAGVDQTLAAAREKAAQTVPAGYSACGVVLEVGSGVADVSVRDRVACAGAQCAYHAEVISVPRNLAVVVPAGVESAYASTVALGAIALQGVRRAQPTLGETFVVMGLGAIGQLTAQMLKANGCRVIGTDVDQARIDSALALGMACGIQPGDDTAIDQVARLTNGYGADGVIITAASASDALVASAFHMCRRKGRVVLVGDVGLNLNRADFYAKELDFLISSSYGPGRYDTNYEEQGLDYPIGHVRWTENRNMQEYLSLLAENRVRLDALPIVRLPQAQATEAYEALKAKTSRPLLALLEYQVRPEARQRRRDVAVARAAGGNALRLALVGAGNFAKIGHIPALATLKDQYTLRAIVSRRGHEAQALATTVGAAYAATDMAEVLADPAIDAVLIATRHDTHTSLALRALEAGKHVLLEKPLALTRADLARITDFYDREVGTPKPLLLTGFNRRFSRCAREIRAVLQARTQPIIVSYRMNAGYVPRTHWVQGGEGGGRNLGEACHVYDLFTFLTGARATRVHASSIVPRSEFYARNDNFVATVDFDDGSVATLTYTAMGSAEHPKERAEIYSEGRVISLDDYRKVVVSGQRDALVDERLPDKGLVDELRAFRRAVTDGEWPIAMWEQLQASEIALEVEDALVAG